MELANALFLGFYEVIKRGAMLGYWPLLFTINKLYIESAFIPNFLKIISSIASALLNRYALLASALFFMLAYKKNFLSPILSATVALVIISPFLLLAPIAFMAPEIIGLAVYVSYAFFKLARSLYRFFNFSENNWKLQNAFKHPFSDESILIVFIATGISMSIKVPTPFFIAVGSILGGYLAIKIKNFLGYIFFGNQPIRLTPYVIPLRVQTIDNDLVARHTNIPSPLLPRHTSPITHTPNLLSEQERIRQRAMNSLYPSSSNPVVPVSHDPILSRPSPFQKVLDLLKNPNNDYLLTENNNFFLRDAAEKSNWDLVSLLLKKPNVAVQAHCGDWLVLRLAIQHDQWKVVSKFLKLPILIKTPGTEEKIDVLNRLCHKVISHDQTDILNQIILSSAYDLFHAQTKCTFLTISIRKNKLAAIIKILNDNTFIQQLSFNNIKDIILKCLPDDHIQKISPQCGNFLTHIKECFPTSNICINQINIQHLVNTDFFGSLIDVSSFFQKPIEYLESKTQNTPHIMIAMNLLQAKNTYVGLKNTRQGAREGAQQVSEVIQANQLFETVKNHYQETFNHKKTIEHSSLEAIEREIKTYLLEQILSEACENINKEKDIEASNQIINLIDLYKEALLDGKMWAHQALIEVFNEYFIPDNTSSAQTAWLSYSALHNVDRNGWKFLVEPTQEHLVYSTAESAQTKNQVMTNIMASNIVRERIAYYWLAVTDETYPDEDNFRLGNFVGAISTIYQTNGFGRSCCYPGHLTGIAQMGLHHPVAEPITLDNLIEQAIVAPIIQASKDTLEQHPNWSAEDKENFLISITFMTENNADEIFHSSSLSPFDTKMYLAFKEHHSFIIDSAFDEILKNQRYQNKNIPLQEREEIKVGIKYKVLAMASNPHIVSSLNDIVLTSRCVRKDITLEETSPFAPNTHKHKLYLVLAKELNKQLLSRSDEKLPTIIDLNKIGGEISKQIIDDIVLGQEPTLALAALQNFGLSVNIDEVKYLNLIQNTESNVLPQFNAQRLGENRNVSQDHPSQKNHEKSQVILR